MGQNKKTKDILTLMTWNLYIGADLSPILTSSKEQIPRLITRVFLQYVTTNFQLRAETIARQIATESPDLIGLQEAEVFQFSTANSTIVQFDYIDILLTELRKLGMYYEIAAVNHNFSIELPVEGQHLKFIDRDVILIRKQAGLKLLAQEKATFQNNLEINIKGIPFEVVRGWSSVDISKNNKTFRVINTHLEPFSTNVQVTQGNELLNGPARTKLPLIVAGDLNSTPEGSSSKTYKNFIGAGFSDVWKKVGIGPGYTCCQAPDLQNIMSTLNRRIDYILYKNINWKPISASLVGNELFDKTPGGLWPSDHAGVVARFEIL